MSYEETCGVGGGVGSDYYGSFIFSLSWLDIKECLPVESLVESF